MDIQVRGALQSVLGRDYIMHSHRHPHINAPGNTPQKAHKDSYFGYNQLRHHRPRWAMLMYYPAETTKDLGPTVIIPGSQYLSLGNMGHHLNTESCPSEWRTDEQKWMMCPAGSVVLIHYDLWHRGTANKGNSLRYMFKFQFMRTKLPTEPSWYCLDTTFPEGSFGKMVDLSPVWRSMWDWYCGKLSTKAMNDEEIEAASQLLFSPSGELCEPWRVAAAYKLGQAECSKTLDRLLEGIVSTDENIYRNAMYGLTARCDQREVLDKVCSILEDTSNSVGSRGAAAFILGESCLQQHDGTVPALLHAVDDASVYIRREVAEALGTCPRTTEQIAPILTALSTFLDTADDQVSYMAAFSIGQTAVGLTTEMAATEDIKSLTYKLDTLSQQSRNRYVRFFALFALQMIPTMVAKDLLIKTLLNTHWDDLTHPASGW